jgi:hypothetical protein
MCFIIGKAAQLSIGFRKREFDRLDGIRPQVDAQIEAQEKADIDSAALRGFGPFGSR